MTTSVIRFVQSLPMTQAPDDRGQDAFMAALADGYASVVDAESLLSPSP